MTSIELPSMSYEEGALRLVLLPELENNFSSSLSLSHQNPEPDAYPQLTSARYGEPSPVAKHNVDHYDSTTDLHEEEPDTDSAPQHEIPIHPIPNLQAAFAESLLEVTTFVAVEKPKLRLLDAPARREALLSQGKNDAPFDAAWRLRPGQTHHEVAKLISQISFGVYLLLDGNANSNVQVVDILQGHIDEVDEFLEVALEDLAEAEKDVTQQIENLVASMSNMRNFEQLLEDRKYRAEILEGNQNIEHILARTNAAMRQWEDDVEAGLQASAVFIKWLNEHREGSWRAEQPDLLEIFDAMNGNAEGWLLAFERMSDSAQDMTSLVIRLMSIISEIEKKAGEVSRRTWANIAPYSSPSGSNTNINSGSSTPASSFRSPRSAAHASMGSGSISGFRPPSSAMSVETGNMDFPLPSHVSLMPPPLRITPSNADFQNEDDGFRLSPATYSPAPKPVASPAPTPDGSDFDEVAQECEATQSPLYVLQPRTYTPQPPAPLPSPMAKDHSARTTQSSFQSTVFSDSRSSAQSYMSPGARAQTWQPTEIVQKRTSLRQRVSLKAKPPQDIHIPPRALEGMEVYAHSSNNSTPRTTPSTYGSEDYQGQHQPHSGSYRSSLSPPAAQSATQSPHSDQQRYYHPVIASPHSPLQQRPHTAAGNGQPAFQHQPMLVPPPLLRNRPSQLGGMSVVSNKSAGSYQSRASTMSAKTPKAGDKLKKKKSAFGWLKKAFSMDDDERAAYEARKAMQHQDRYYDTAAPKFLDGRRVRR
ncbi:hypothetical protein PT974_05880 [Cladobotryum mycophilum]|uniref:Uncharacterized protein n=1 Tax=Cladobotryum mycophilum TaxID=491253 RepID=A0ABR0SJZ5_9HYPO